MAAKQKNTLLWFRKGLRLHDNPALLAACDGADHVFPVFCLDPWFISSGRVGPNRINFLLESLRDLDEGLRKRGSRLIMLRGKPTDVIPAAMDAWGVQLLAFERDTEPYALTRDLEIADAAGSRGIKVCNPVSHTLYDSDKLIKLNGGKAPTTMGAFTKLHTKHSPAPPVGEAPDAMPPVDTELMAQLSAEMLQSDGAVPSLEEIGHTLPETGPPPFRGGETEALRRMEEHLANTQWVCEFEKPKGNPALFRQPATTVLSPYLKFGCLSARLFHQRILQVYAKNKHTQPPTSLLAQLLWREFFYTVGHDTPNFDKMEGNPSIRQIGWDVNPAFQEAWEFGRTGYPWIDAIMNQLRRWGWMHHLARHSVACFLTRGDLYCHWEVGRDVFDKYLLDGDHFINNGNWQWLSASNFFYQYFRVYSPVSFGQKYDKDGDYIRYFVPVLKDMPAKYIYEPWKAPIEVQRKANCIIGKDYPKPIVDHKEASKACMARHQAAYQAAKDGNAGDIHAGSESQPRKRPAAEDPGQKQQEVTKRGAPRQRKLSFSKAEAPASSDAD